MRLLVEEVAPAADGLRERDGRRDQVGHAQEGSTVVAADEEGDDEAGDEPPVYRQAAVSNVEYGRPVAGVDIEIEEDVVGAGADDGRGDHKDHQVEDEVGVHAVAACPFVADQRGEEEPGSDQDAVPLDVQAEDGKSDGVRCVHRILSLVQSSRIFACIPARTRGSPRGPPQQSSQKPAAIPAKILQKSSAPLYKKKWSMSSGFGIIFTRAARRGSG